MFDDRINNDNEYFVLDKKSTSFKMEFLSPKFLTRYEVEIHKDRIRRLCIKDLVQKSKTFLNKYNILVFYIFKLYKLIQDIINYFCIKYNLVYKYKLYLIFLNITFYNYYNLTTIKIYLKQNNKYSIRIKHKHKSTLFIIQKTFQVLILRFRTIITPLLNPSTCGIDSSSSPPSGLGLVKKNNLFYLSSEFNSVSLDVLTTISP
ncbi:hypothetical protein AGLY_008534 [Aphis glycines]|uniref:Uncharacterized protein n=1 Tax=Aphis glycines TaxID=307491 RepID=A0A6G0TKN6_APHGL|nr:hypothetical protein AGLY_008534 [Aphis glycines]